MTLKVVRILSEPRTNADPGRDTKNAGQLRPQQNIPTASFQIGVSTEAAVTSLRSLRGALGTEKIKDSKEAKEVAERVADKIREENNPPEPHSGLEEVSAREHLAN